ncbi:MAG: DUF465 domain-containing protein [Desulfonatronovibrio sp. MSAO_Bac4]|nr:MAG: DUF465 domain-containing protein [Desulfonatronovibrio sp. MSAO_Bac4]
MEQYELELIAKYGESDEELKKLWDDHLSYEKILEKYESKSFLTPVEDQEVKELKKKKLTGKTRMHAILDKYKKTEG